MQSIWSLLLSLMPILFLQAQDWPRWLGPTSLGDAGHAVQLPVPDGQLAHRWQWPLPGNKCHATPLVVDEVVYLQASYARSRMLDRVYLTDVDALTRRLSKEHGKQRAFTIRAWLTANKDGWADEAAFVVWAGKKGVSAAEGALIQKQLSNKQSYALNVLYALDLQSGAERWRQEWDSTFENPGGVHATPAIQDETIYLVDAGGYVHARAISDGAQHWTTSEALRGNYAGPNASVIIDGDALYMAHKKGVVSIDRQSGKRRWASEPSADAVWATEDNTLALCSRAGQKLVLVPSLGQRDNKRLVALAADTGALAWTLPKGSAARYLTPLCLDDDVILQLGDATVVYDLGQSEPRLRFVVKHPTGKKKIKDNCATPVARGQRIWFGNSDGTHCIDRQSGAVLWHNAQARVTKSGSMVLAGSHLVAFGYDCGNWLMIDADTGAVVHRQVYPDRWNDRGPRASVVVAAGHVLLKLHKGLVCYKP